MKHKNIEIMENSVKRKVREEGRRGEESYTIYESEMYATDFFFL